jgi:hypothetical protein
MIKKLSCKKCSADIKIDYSKAPSSPFKIACPSCSQIYQLNKPTPTPVSSKTNPKIDLSKSDSTSKPQTNPYIADGLREIICVSCKKGLRVDFSKITKYPVTVQCKYCQTKLRFNNPPGLKSNLKTDGLDKLQKTKNVKIDINKINPRQGFAYNLFRFTRTIQYVNKLTLLIFLGHLINKITRTLSNIKIDQISPEYFQKIKLEVGASSELIYKSTINPLIVEAGINPRLLTWANNWFIKKLSSRLLLAILVNNRVNMNTPYIKKFKVEVDAENAAVTQILTHPIVMAFYFWFSLQSAMGGMTELITISIFGALIPYAIVNKLQYRSAITTFPGALSMLALVFILYGLFDLYNDFIQSINLSLKGYVNFMTALILFEFVKEKWGHLVPNILIDIVNKINSQIALIIAGAFIVFHYLKLIIAS